MKPGCGVMAAIVVAMALVPASCRRARRTIPSRSITVIVPFPAGGAERRGGAHRHRPDGPGSLGQSIVIENVGGAGGTLGSARVAAAAPDGYTLLAARWARMSRRRC